MNSAPKTVSLIVPVYNEQDALGVFFAAIQPRIREIRNLLGENATVEIVFVDDGSTDGTVDEICKRDHPDFNIQLIRFSRNFGKENAIAAGLHHATGDAVIPMDVDLQDPPTLLPRMISAWLEGAIVVNAKRSGRATDSAVKRFTSTWFYWLFNRLSDYEIQPNVGDFRLLDRRVVNILNQVTERIRFNKALFSWVGFAPVTLTYDRPPRAAGVTKWNYWKLWNFALDGLTATTTLPLRMWTYLGGVLALLSLAFAGFIFLKTVFWGVDVPGYSSTLIIVLLFGATNLMALGMMGEYVGRIAVEVRGRPSYIISEKINLGRQAPPSPSTERDQWLVEQTLEKGLESSCMQPSEKR